MRKVCSNQILPNLRRLNRKMEKKVMLPTLLMSLKMKKPLVMYVNLPKFLKTKKMRLAQLSRPFKVCHTEHLEKRTRRSDMSGSTTSNPLRGEKVNQKLKWTAEEKHSPVKWKNILRNS
ncbi:unnamed protein product [Thlaspi arvense]|uniref:Uncharacterized protein n=1 Tax=Thlaspi arvense TaxID=13288 RepID=A0AAU9T6C4_THLAR|nr:unnamed protein product [Thlaspi arvense]